MWWPQEELPLAGKSPLRAQEVQTLRRQVSPTGGQSQLRPQEEQVLLRQASPIRQSSPLRAQAVPSLSCDLLGAVHNATASTGCRPSYPRLSNRWSFAANLSPRGQVACAAARLKEDDFAQKIANGLLKTQQAVPDYPPSSSTSSSRLYSTVKGGSASVGHLSSRAVPLLSVRQQGRQEETTFNENLRSSQAAMAGVHAQLQELRGKMHATENSLRAVLQSLSEDTLIAYSAMPEVPHFEDALAEVQLQAEEDERLDALLRTTAEVLSLEAGHLESGSLDDNTPQHSLGRPPEGEEEVECIEDSELEAEFHWQGRHEAGRTLFCAAMALEC